MALKITDLSVLAYANNFTLWHYKTADASVTTTGYYNNSSDMMRVGDMIIVNAGIGGTPVTKLHIVTAITGGAVSVAVYS